MCVHAFLLYFCDPRVAGRSVVNWEMHSLLFLLLLLRQCLAEGQGGQMEE